MKHVNVIFKFFFFFLMIALVSCQDEDTKPKGKYEDGVFVINEGNFKSSDGSISFYNRETTEIQQDIFGAANNGLALGDVVQSMNIYNGQAFIVVNNDNKLDVVDANTFVLSYTMSDLKLPRYFTTFNNTGYLTEWVSYSDSGRVSVINLSTHAVEKSITTDYGAENIVEKNGMLYVSNSFTTTVSVIDPAQNKVVKTIDVGSSPGSFVVDKNGKLWVVCGGGFDLDYKPLNDGALYQINTTDNTVDKAIELSINIASKIAINKTNDKIYYYQGNNVYEIRIDATEKPSSPLLTEGTAVSFYGIGFDPKKELIYTADAKSFVGNGVVYRYTTSGVKVDSYTSGRGPSGFVFN